MKQINVLFDATILIESMSLKSSERTGVYWATYNILHQIIQDRAFIITLLLPSRKLLRKIDENDRIIFSLPYIVFKQIDKYSSKIKLYFDYIKKTKNILQIFYKFLQIIKNISYVIIIKLTPKIKLNNFNVFISPFYNIPDIVKEIKSIKLFHILYDCIPILYSVSSMGIQLNQWFVKISENLNKDTYYFCISECTKNDFFKFFSSNLDEKKMYITLMASSQIFFPNYNKDKLREIKQKYKIKIKENHQYIFSLCSIDPRKNLVFTIKCFFKFIEKHNIKNLYFYLGGGYFKDYIDKFNKEINNFDICSKFIIRLGYVDDSDVNILYSNSLFFAFLSQYEGFGIPPLEAMQAGTPVICSNNSSLPEVVGDAAITIAYDDEEACIKAFENFYFNEDVRKEYINRGLERAKLFSWEKTVNKMTDIIKKITS